MWHEFAGFSAHPMQSHFPVPLQSQNRRHGTTNSPVFLISPFPSGKRVRLVLNIPTNPSAPHRTQLRLLQYHLKEGPTCTSVWDGRAACDR